MRMAGMQHIVLNLDNSHVIQKWHTITRNLVTQGYALFDGTLFEGDARALSEAREDFVASCRDLRPDYFTEGPGRNRRYGQFILKRDEGTLRCVAPVWSVEKGEYVTHYEQQGCFNPEHGGVARAFAALTRRQSENLFLHELIRKCFYALPWRYGATVLAGVHIIEFAVEPGQKVASSPSRVHCDGEPFTWAFLLERSGIRGGENIFASIDCCGKSPDELDDPSIFNRITLERRWEGWVVDDQRVSHYVSPVETPDGFSFGRRTMLLVDFSVAPTATMTG